MYVSLLVNITSQHYAGLSSPHVKDTEGGEERDHLVHDHLQQWAVLLGPVQVFDEFIVSFLISKQGNNK